MTPRPKSPETQPTAPPSFPQVPPPQPGSDVSGWVLNAVTQLNGATAKIDARLDSIEKLIGKLDEKLDRVETEVAGFGKWMHTLKVCGGILVIVLGWTFANAVWPFLKTKLGLQ